MLGPFVSLIHCCNLCPKGDKKTAAQLYKQASEIRASDVASSQAGLSFRSFESESSSYNGNPRISRTSGSQPKLDNVSKVENVSA